jgi:cytochrome P450
MKEVPPEGDTIHGRFIPGGTKIGHNMWSIQRHEVYGADLHMYRPERWLEAGVKQVQMEKVLDLVFGHGRWGCLGKPIAYIELNKVFVEVSQFS